MVRTHLARIEEIGADRTVTVAGRPSAVPLLRHVEANVNDVAVLLIDGGLAWVVGVTGSASPPPPPPKFDPEVSKPVAPPPVAEDMTLRPTWSGTYRGGWRPDTSALVQGDWTGRGINQGGCWWGELPNQIVGGSIHLVRSAGGYGAAQTPTIALLAGTSRPTGAPTVLATAPGPSLKIGQAKTWPIPEDWLPRMGSGEAGGIGVTSSGARGPYVVLDASGAGMTLTLTAPR